MTLFMDKLTEQQISLKSEENLKNKVILPYLQSLGIGKDEIEFETPFNIRLGHHVYKVNKGTQASTAHGRSDILCKRGGQNLFIIEVKAENVKLTEDDIEQGISYASLVRPIAPFVLVTNGKETKVIDTITGADLIGTDIGLQSTFWKGGCKLSADEDIQLRYNALLHFIGYSPQNLIAFSCSQVNDRIQELRGNKQELNKKYIPELYLDRTEIKDAFQEFLKSSPSCFAIIGEAGVGKTNYICALTESIIGNQIVLFFNIATLAGEIIHNIKDDFNWIFSSIMEAPEIFRRLDALLDKTRSQKVCIFLDAIDEATSPTFVLELNDLVRRIKNFPDVKLCISCKSSEWNRFLSYQGSPTLLAESIFKPLSNDEQEKGAKTDSYSIFIKQFDDDELSRLEPIYKKHFKYDGMLSGSVRDECHLGFMLRIVAEVYSNKQLPTVIDNIHLLNSYLDRKFDKVDAEISQNCLREIGAALINDQSQTSHKNLYILRDKIEESDLRKRMDLKATDKLPIGLFAYNILTRTSIDGISYIGFYYSRIRDYAIAILALRLPTLSGDYLKKLIPSLFQSSVGQSALSWYASIANNNHKRILNEQYQSCALLFLDEYVRLIETHFSILRDQFDPYTKTDIGLVISGFGQARAIFGFRAVINRNEQKVLVLNEAHHKGNADKFFKIGVHIVHSIFKFASNPKESAFELVKEQLIKIVEEGKLNEDKNFYLALEKIICIIYNYSEQLGFQKPRMYTWLPQVDYILPVEIEVLEKRIQLFYAHKYYETEIIRENIKFGKIPIKRSGDIISYSVNKKLLNEAEIEKRAVLAVNACRHFPDPNISGDFPPFSILSNALKIFRQQTDEITEPLFPAPDISLNKINERIFRRGGRTNFIPDIVTTQYSDERLKEYLQRFFYSFLNEYRIIIEYCFPTLKSKFHLYSLLPIEIRIEACTKDLTNWNLEYGFRRSPTQAVLIKVEINPLDTEIDRWKGFDSVTSLMLSEVFHTSRPVRMDERIIRNMDQVLDMCVLRSWVYNEISNEITGIFRYVRSSDLTTEQIAIVEGK